MARKDKYIKAWFRYASTRPETIDGKLYDNVTILYYFDCKERTNAVMQAAYYLRSEGVHTKLVAMSDAKFMEAVPGSVADAQTAYLCDKKPAPTTRGQ